MEKIDLITAADLRAAFTAFRDYVDGGQVPVPPGPPHPEPPEPTANAEFIDAYKWTVVDRRPQEPDVFVFKSSVAENPYIPGETAVIENSLRFTVNEPINMRATPGSVAGTLWVRRNTNAWFIYDTTKNPYYSVTLEPGDYLLFTAEGAVNVWMKVSDFGGVPVL